MTKQKSYTHSERQKFAEKAAKEYYAKETNGPPPLDRDFIEPYKTDIKKYRHLKRYSAIAAAVVLVLLAGITISITTSDNDVAYGDKGILHRIYKSFMGINTDQQDEAPAEEYRDSLVIKSMDDIDKAITFADGHLYVPEYIPAKYKLDNLKIERAGDNSFMASYTFKKGNQCLQIGELDISNDEQVSASGEGETIHLKDRIIFLRDGGTDRITSIDVYTENIVCSIGGNITKEEALEIAKNLKQKQK